MKHIDMRKFRGSGVISATFFSCLLLCLACCCGGCVPAIPRHRTYPPQAANYEKVMASAKIGQTTLQELRPRFGAGGGTDYQDSKMHGVYCRWEVEYSLSASVPFGWKEGGRDWFYEPGEHMLMMEFDEADRLQRYEFKTVNKWEECDPVFRQWLQQSKHESK